jgi:hypothetical protein
MQSFRDLFPWYRPRVFSLQEPAFFTRLKKAKRVLVAGAGGGFDVYAGLPLAVALSEAGREVHLANLPFTALYGLDSGGVAGSGCGCDHAGHGRK